MKVLGSKVPPFLRRDEQIRFGVLFVAALRNFDSSELYSHYNLAVLSTAISHVLVHICPVALFEDSLDVGPVNFIQ